MKKILASVALVGALVLSGCSYGGAYGEAQKTDQERQSEEQRAGNLFEQKVYLSDGRTVTCIIYEDSRKGGLSCDWEKKS